MLTRINLIELLSVLAESEDEMDRAPEIMIEDGLIAAISVKDLHDNLVAKIYPSEQTLYSVRVNIPEIEADKLGEYINKKVQRKLAELYGLEIYGNSLVFNFSEYKYYQMVEALEKAKDLLDATLDYCSIMSSIMFRSCKTELDMLVSDFIKEEVERVY